MVVSTVPFLGSVLPHVLRMVSVVAHHLGGHDAALVAVVAAQSAVAVVSW